VAGEVAVKVAAIANRLRRRSQRAEDATMSNRRICLAAAGTLFAAMLAACSGSVDVVSTSNASPGSASASAGGGYAGNGVAFDYPPGWRLLQQQEATSTTGGNQLWTQAVGPGQSASSVVIVSAYQLRLDVSKVAPDQLKTEIDSTLDQLAQQAGGSRIGGLQNATLGSLTGYQATINAQSPSGEDVQSRVVFGFDRDVEYFVNCQYEADTKAPILDGCDAIQGSFAVR
jgi:hypothetical protein